MNKQIKTIAIAGALAMAVPASASAHHDDNDYKFVRAPNISGLVQKVSTSSVPASQPSVQSPAQVTTPRIKVYRRTYVQGGKPGTLGIKISCKTVTGSNCSGQLGIGPAGRLGTRSFQLRQGNPQIVRVNLSRGTLARFFWQGKLTTGLTIQANDELGNASLTTGELNLLKVR